MAQSRENIWTPRFLLLVGLVLAGQLLVGIIVYTIFGHSYVRTELALTAFLLLSGIGTLALLQEPTPRKIVLGAGFFILIALLTLVVSSGLQVGLDGGQAATSFRLFLSYVALILAILALPGKFVMCRAKLAEETEDIIEQPTAWFIRLSHLALAALAGTELFLQLFFGNRLLFLPFASRLYAGLSLNSAVVLLLGAILVFSLLRFKSPLTLFDGCMILILSCMYALFQYTFGGGEFAAIDPQMSQSLIVGINLGFSLLPLALAIFALFSEWGRLIALLWLAIQLLTIQQFLEKPLAPGGAGSLSQFALSSPFLLSIMIIAVILLALRLLFYWQYPHVNVIDGITVALIALVVSLTVWSLGQSDFQQAQSFATTPPGINLLSLSYILTVITCLIGISAILAAVLICIPDFFRQRYPWLSRIASIDGSLLTLSITVGALFLLNSLGTESSYLASTTLNLQRVNASLPAFPIRNQYVLDGLFVLLLLIYVPALVTQRWERSFANTERMLVLLSGCTCLLILLSPGKRPILPLVSSNVQQMGGYILPAFSAERIVTTSVLLAALISLLWLNHSRNMTDRIVLLVLFCGAAIFTLLCYIPVLSPLLLLPLILMVPGILIATKIASLQVDREIQDSEQPSDETVNNGAPLS